MRYRGQQFDHRQADKTGILLTNLGTPGAPTRTALKTYLKQFLSDPRVVEVPRLLWWLILNGIILNVRPARSARAYARVWTERGSPLALHTAAQADALAAALTDNKQLLVRWAMRYGAPAIGDVLQEMLDAGVRRLLVLPLYPQYSAATTASTFDALAADFSRRRWLPELRFVTNYYRHPLYIRALAGHIRAFREQHGSAEVLVFSYHGVPLRYLHAGDPYHCQCLATSRLVATELGLREGQYLTSFQSRFGREEWLKPYTDETLRSLPADGIKSVQVVCPGFAADCLETIDEIGVENREYFLAAGGEHFAYIPALNAAEEHIALLQALVQDNIQGWDTSVTTTGERQTRFEQYPFNRQ